MKNFLVAAAALGAAVLGCGGSGDATGFKSDTGGNGPAIGGAGGQSAGGHHPEAGGSGAGGELGGGSPTSSSSGSGAGGSAACPIFPADNWWNTDISASPVDPNSDGYVKYINQHPQPHNQNEDPDKLHADFDSGGDGIPYNLVDASTPKVDVTFHYAHESDPGPYPLPANFKQEGGSDGHVLLVDLSACKLYEMGNVAKSGNGWAAGAGAIWNLKTNDLRHDCWTSADAAGLPIYPGLVRYDEVTAGAINHALRFTVNESQKAWIKPARHQAGADDGTDAPPMGLRFRLKSSASDASVAAAIASAGPQPKVVLIALQKYGMFVADNGSNWFVTGEPNGNWDDDSFHAAFDPLKGEDFEVVQAADPIEYPSSPSCN